MFIYPRLTDHYFKVSFYFRAIFYVALAKMTQKYYPSKKFPISSREGGDCTNCTLLSGDSSFLFSVDAIYFQSQEENIA